MVKDQLVTLIKDAAAAAQRSGALPEVALPDIVVEHPANEAHGDYATNVALRMARAVRMPPMRIAAALQDALPATPFLDTSEVAAPGFINFRLAPAWLAAQVDEILEQGVRFGDLEIGQGLRIQLEFVSANPTGPLHVGSGRGGAIGDTLANVLAAAGFAVEREYYINDAGRRMETFFATLLARYVQQLGGQADVPEEGYHGAYMVDLARRVIAEEGQRYLEMPAEEARVAIGRRGMEILLQAAREDLSRMRINYDTWYSEQSLFDAGLVQQTIDLLQERGYIAEREGAVWFVSTALGEDKDNVLVRGNGVPTYFASDIAYHRAKFVERGFQRVIDVWGADHQGHIPRMKAAIRALGLDADDLVIIINQLVTLRRGAEIVRMSKRSGDVITLREVLDEVGPDACRYNFLSRTADSQMDFDLELAKQQSNENPVYYVQYAHARIASILRLAEEKGINFAGGEVGLLRAEPELVLIRRMLQLPEVIELAAQTLEPHRLPYYAQELAREFHSFYNLCRVIDEADLARSRARLKLVAAARIVLARTLHLMGMDAPETM